MHDCGAVLLCIKETWLRCARAAWLHSVRTGKQPCIKEMKTKSHSRGLKSRIGCLWKQYDAVLSVFQLIVKNAA